MRGSDAWSPGVLTQLQGGDGKAYHGTSETLNFALQATVAVRPNLKLSFEGVNLTDAFSDPYIGERNRLNV